MDYAATAALMVDVSFRDRVKVACLHFAVYILGEANSIPAHNTRLKWAQTTVVDPASSVVAIMPTLVMDPQVQTDGAAISDTALQTAVETTINKLM